MIYFLIAYDCILASCRDIIRGIRIGFKDILYRVGYMESCHYPCNYYDCAVHYTD